MWKLNAKRSLGFALVGSVTIVSACSRSKLPQTGSEAYTRAVSTFYVGLAALQVGDDARAQDELAGFVKLVPAEPAGWGNWGVLALRQRNYDAAAERLEKAADLAPRNDHIEYLQGLLESERGNSGAAIEHLRKAMELNPQNLHAAYQLAQEVERQGGANSDAEVQNTIEKILATHPDNLAALVELSRIAAKRGDQNALKSAVDRIYALSSDWPPEAKQQLQQLQSTISSGGPRAAGTRTVFLKNVLMRVPEYRLSLSALKAPPGDEAQPFTHFLRMETPPFEPAVPDMSLAFVSEPLPGGEAGHWDWVGAISLGITGPATAVEADRHRIHLTAGPTLAFPGADTPPSPEAILGIDFNYDFKTDLVLAGAGGVRFFRQGTASAFTDVTEATKLPRAILDAKYLGAWAADIEADGDLDVVMGTATGVPTVLRNNGDGSFAVIHPFAGVSGGRAFVWADLDGDGNPDASLIDGDGHLHVFTNLRTGQFKERSLPRGLPPIKSIATADVNNDGILDLLAVQSDGKVIALSDRDEGKSFDTTTIATIPDAINFLKNDVRLRVADLDNNGALDLILAHVSGSDNGSGALIWLGDGTGKFTLVGSQTPPRVFDAADLNGDGRLGLLSLDNSGAARLAVSHGSKTYHWVIIRPHAKQAAGDQRINPFGVGGEIEIRSGLLVQKQPISGPLLHFGLGDQTHVDVARVVWPNGSVRAEFDLKSDQEVVTEQRLKGSCPFLFAYNGNQVEFVKDAVPWSSAIGLKINTIGTARVEATEEWYKIGGNELAPHDGHYDLRFTAELWETYYYDYLNFMTVDHPAGTDIYLDERFVIPPAKLAITTVETPHAIARAVDDNGQDVTDILRELDGKYLDTFGRGQYQGVTRDHYVEIDLGDASTSGPLYLIARGWMHPTDSSINVAIAQGNHQQAKALSLEVPDGKGGWVVARPNLGFPAGRKKICLFDLTNVFRPGTARKVRLRTNLEIYWDQIRWAKGLAGTPLKITQLAPEMADLHYRGYSVIKQANPSSPELPDYNHLEGTVQRYRDLTGYYTRYGDVRELLQKVDDRYVIMNSGDEMTLRFAEQPPPAAGWVRDYVIAGDGWIKDGDYNSTFSKTVLPLPYHAKNLYVTPPKRLEDEWVYRHHPEDWEGYQTRYVSDDVFDHALRNTQ